MPSTWVATRTHFTPVNPETVEGGWSFGPAAAGRDATIIDTLPKGEGVLKLPTGCYAVRDLPAGYLDRNIYGAVRVYEAPGLVRYRVFYAEKAVLDAPPEAGDLAVPAQEKAHIARIARELNLTGEPPSRALAKIGNFFRDNFRYSLVLQPGDEKGALEHFLTALARRPLRIFCDGDSPPAARGGRTGPVRDRFFRAGLQPPGRPLRCPGPARARLGPCLRRRLLARPRHHAVGLGRAGKSERLLLDAGIGHLVVAGD